jgi:hypothetical protein
VPAPLCTAELQQGKSARSGPLCMKDKDKCV